ncbi:hypothetical protein FHT03_000601 [Xanthomonas arboricola]|nr:hypothetical protein [Xanthomonas cannabis]
MRGGRSATFSCEREKEVWSVVRWPERHRLPRAGEESVVGRALAGALPSPACGGRCPQGGWGASEARAVSPCLPWVAAGPWSAEQSGASATAARRPEDRHQPLVHLADQRSDGLVNLAPSPARGKRECGWLRVGRSAPSPASGKKERGWMRIGRSASFSRLRGEGARRADGGSEARAVSLCRPCVAAGPWSAEQSGALPSPACGGRCPQGGWGRAKPALSPCRPCVVARPWPAGRSAVPAAAVPRR